MRGRLLAMPADLRSSGLPFSRGDAAAILTRARSARPHFSSKRPASRLHQNLPVWKSFIASTICSGVFITNGP